MTRRVKELPVSGHLDERLEAIADAIASDSDPIISLDVADVTALLAEVRALRTERDENAGAMKVWRRRCQDAEDERDRLRDGIAAHQARWGITSRSDLEYREEANRALWSLLDGEADV